MSGYTREEAGIPAMGWEYQRGRGCTRGKGHIYQREVCISDREDVYQKELVYQGDR